MTINSYKNVYKYYREEHHADILGGLFYVNTFEAIRKSDSSKMIGDPDEAYSETLVDLEIKLPYPDAQNLLDQAVPNFINILEGADGTITFKNFTSVRRLPNAYMYCVTHDRDDDYWREEHGYNKCFRIFDFDEFSLRMGQSIINSGINLHQLAVSKCFYEENKGRVTNQVMNPQMPDYFRKTLKHASQKEIRSVFSLLDVNEKIDPIKVTIEVDNLIRILK